MRLKCAVFAGPSLDSENCLNLGDDFKIFPPCKAGDIYQILAMDFNAILIVDGLFHGAPSVWHREILSAIHNEIIVVGSSSMGALRAAELSDEGMIGIGKVYEWFKTKAIEADDEVALSHSPTKPYNALSEPMVDIRHQVDEFISKKGICYTDEIFKNAVIKVAKEIHYWNRTPRELDKALEEELINKEQTMEFIKRRKKVKSIKKHDFRQAVDFLRENFAHLISQQIKTKGISRYSMYKKDDYALYAMLTREYKNSVNISIGEILPWGYNFSKANIFNFIGCILEEKQNTYSSKQENIDIKRSQKYEPYKWGLLRNELNFIELIIKKFLHYAQKIKDFDRKNQENISKAYIELREAQDSINPFIDVTEDRDNSKTLFEVQVELIQEFWKTKGICLKHLLNIYETVEKEKNIADLCETSQIYIMTGYFGPTIIGLSEQLCYANNIKFVLYEHFALHNKGGSKR